MATIQERLDLEKIFPVNSWVMVTPDPRVAKNGDRSLANLCKLWVAGKTAQVRQINGRLIQVAAGEHLAWVMPDWIIRTEAPKPSPQKNVVFENYIEETRKANAKRDNNLREIFGYATTPPTEFADGEVIWIDSEAKTASGKTHPLAGRRAKIRNVYRNHAGMWAANVTPASLFDRSKQSVSVLMNYMKKL